MVRSLPWSKHAADRARRTGAHDDGPACGGLGCSRDPAHGWGTRSTSTILMMGDTSTSSWLNVATYTEAIAEAHPDRDALVFRDRQLSWAQVAERTRRLANVLRGAGLGIRGDFGAGPRWESVHDHVALYMHNGNEYLEGMLGAWKARCAPFNVNYRYVAEELTYLLDDAQARAVIYHECFAPLLAEVLGDLSVCPDPSPPGRRRIGQRAARRRHRLRDRPCGRGDRVAGCPRRRVVG